MKFINPVVAAAYTPRPGQADTDIIIPKLSWRSKLSRITPRVAEHLLAGGTNLFTKKPAQPQAIAADPSPEAAMVGVLTNHPPAQPQGIAAPKKRKPRKP